MDEDGNTNRRLAVFLLQANSPWRFHLHGGRGTRNGNMVSLKGRRLKTLPVKYRLFSETGANKNYFGQVRAPFLLFLVLLKIQCRLDVEKYDATRFIYFNTVHFVSWYRLAAWRSETYNRVYLRFKYARIQFVSGNYIRRKKILES